MTKKKVIAGLIDLLEYSIRCAYLWTFMQMLIMNKTPAWSCFWHWSTISLLPLVNHNMNLYIITVQFISYSFVLFRHCALVGYSPFLACFLLDALHGPFLSTLFLLLWFPPTLLILPSQTNRNLTSILLPSIRIPTTHHLTTINQSRITSSSNTFTFLWSPKSFFQRSILECCFPFVGIFWVGSRCRSGF